MKKTVRIRKAKPGETPGYINKTKQFLEKAQMGMSVNQDPKRMQQMYNSAYMDLMNETPADIVYYKLIGDYAIDAETANMILMSAFQQLVNEGYISPETMQNQQGQQENNQPQDQTAQEPSQEEMIDQQEEEQLAMSEMQDDDNSHIYDYAAEDDFDEQQMQEQAFKYGGYFNEGGYTDQDPILDQYDRAGQMNQPNFSLDELIQQQAGVQLFNPQSSQIGDYIGNYNSMGDNWNSQNWLAKKGGSVPKLPKFIDGGEAKAISPYLQRIASPFVKGYDWYNKIAPMQNVSAVGRALPIFTGLGYGLHKTPGLNWMLGMKAGPQQLTSTTQNIYELNKVLQGADPKLGTFSKHVDNPSELSVDRLMFATEDLQNIVTKGNTEGRSSFALSEISNGEGAIGGIYDKNSKITLGVDDAGNNFFEISTKFNPGQKTPFSVIPSNAKSTSFRNRFYYKPNEATGSFDFFDGLGKPLVAGTDNLYQVTRPIVPSLYRTLTGAAFNEPGNILGTRGIMGLQTGPGINDQSFLRNLVSRKDLTSLPPQTWDKLGFKGKLGRGLEQLGFQYGTFPFGLVSSIAGYNPTRTMAKNIKEISIPSIGYANSAQPGLTTPLQEVNRAEDMLNNTDWFRRKGANAAIGLGIGSTLGYGIYDAFYGEDDSVPVGPIRNLLPRDNKLYDINQDYRLTVPDSLQGLGLPYMNEQNYYRDLRRDSNSWQMPDWDTVPENYKKGGSIPKAKYGVGKIINSAAKVIDDVGSGFKEFENVAKNAHKVYVPNSTKKLLRNLNIGSLGTVNSLAKIAAPVMMNPMRALVFGSPIEEVGPFTGSPLNTLPFYGYKYPSSDNPVPGMAFRKMGDNLDWVKNTGIISPAHGAKFRIGKNQMIGEGNWSEPDFVNERYPGVFMAAFAPPAYSPSGSNIQQHFIPGRGGVLVNEGMDKPYNSIMDPGVTLHRRLPFSNRYLPINMDKLRNDQFDWRTMGGNAQSILERLGYLGAGAAGAAFLGGDNPVHDYYKENVYEPIENAIEEAGEYMESEKKKIGGKVSKKKFTKKLLSFYEEGGANPEDPNAIGKGNRMDTAVRDVQNIKDGFLSNLKDSSNKAITGEIYDLAKTNPQIMNTLMQDGYKENLAEDQGQPMAKFGMDMGDVPSWYTGYMNNMPSPREYRKLFKQLKRMMPRGNDISRAGYASAIGGFPNPYATLSVPGYMSMFNDYALGNYGPFMGGYYGGGYQTPNDILETWGTGRRSSQDQAKEVEIINNTKGTGVHRDPIVGETWDSWWTSNGSTPGFRPDKRKWNGSEWVHDKEDLQLFDNSPNQNSDINDYMNFFSGMKMQRGGFVDMNAENPLYKFIQGGMESSYYEPYDIPMASNGVNIMNQRGEQRVVGDKMDYDQWLDAETNVEDWEAINPQGTGEEYDEWLADFTDSANESQRQQEYQDYENFYNQALNDYMMDGANNNVSNNNQTQNNQTQNNQRGSCPPGYVYSRQYDTCMPMAKINYNYRRGPATSGGLFRTLAPWNPLISRGMPWTQQMSLPYYLNNRNPYMGQLSGNPDARIVTKSGWLTGRPKKYIDIYNTKGDGLDVGDIERLRNMYDPKARRQNQRQERRDQRQDKSDQRMRDRGPSKRELIDQQLMKDDWTRENWDDLSRADKRYARRTYAFENPEYRRPSDKFVFGAQGTRFFEDKKSRRQKEKGYGGVPEARFGISTGFDPNTGYTMGMGQNESAYNQYSPDAQFQNDLFGNNVPRSAPSINNYNPFAFINQTGTGSYAETKNTGVTLDQQGQNVIERNANMTQNQQQNQTNDDGLVGVENKNKWMWEVVPTRILDSGVNPAGRWAAKAISGIGDGKRQSNFTLDTTATEKNYANTNNIFRGNWGSTLGQGAGMFRYDQEGQIASGRAADVTAKYGRYLQEGGTHKMFNGLNMRNSDHKYYDEGEEVFMTREELENYLAAGGQVEYLY